MNESTSSHWIQLGRELRARLADPLKHPTFVFNFLGVIVFAGGLGVLYSVFVRITTDKVTDAVELAIPQNLATYFIALVAAAHAELILPRSATTSLRTLSHALLWIEWILAVIALASPNLARAWWCAGVGTVVALLLWWIANSQNMNLRDEPVQPEDAIGDLSNPVTGNLGDIKG